MGLVDKPAFTAGELDPAIWERTNLDKYRNGLATARNWIISKTGSILTRPGRKQVIQCKLVNSAVIIYSPPGGLVFLEWGHLYVRIYSTVTGALLADVAQTFLASDIPNLRFDTSGSYVYIFCSGKVTQRLNYSTYTFDTAATIFGLPNAPSAFGNTPSGTPAGYAVEYAVTYTLNGVESVALLPGTSCNLPIATGQQNSLAITCAAQTVSVISQANVYRRPYHGGAFGYVGSTTQFAQSGGNTIATFIDVGADADYTHSPPTVITPAPVIIDPNNPYAAVLLSNTGIIYQQRLLLTDSVVDLEAIYASQPGQQGVFTQNYPVDDVSALKFKAGTSGFAKVLRMLDSDGLVVFTAAGIFLNQGALTPDNLALAKKGKWIINPSMPPLAIPGGTIFLDSMTNGVRNLLWSFQLNSFDAEEVSIYSNHLFRSRTLGTWGFQPGYFPLLWVVFSDGTAATFTYEYNQQMQAWTRHDSQLPIDSCGVTTNADQVYFVVTKTDLVGNVTRYIEQSVPRYATPAQIASDPDWDKNISCAYMDSITSTSGLMVLNGTDVFTFAPTQFLDIPHTQPDWTEPLNLDCGTSGLFTGSFIVGSILRFFDEDESVVDVKVLSITDTNHCQVQIDNIDEFPSEWVTGARLYLTFTQITGLTYMELEYPAVIVDGAVLCSPNNDDQNYDELQVSNTGVLTLPSPAAICHVGRPIVGDLETLDIDTVEQQPTLIESLVVNKVYVKVKDASGLYIGPTFPVTDDDDINENGVTGMVSIDNFPVDYTHTNPIIGNRAQPSQTKRYEIMTQGDYSQQGKICVRQVDPLHAEILSFIPDVEVLKRSDR